jgi:hypothetical protein
VIVEPAVLTVTLLPAAIVSVPVSPLIVLTWLGIRATASVPLVMSPAAWLWTAAAAVMSPTVGNLWT